MPFVSKCPCEALHGEWGCPPGGALESKIAVPVKRKLLELSGKSENKNYHNRIPKFCQSCIRIGTEQCQQGETVTPLKQAGMESVPAEMDCEQCQQEETDTPMQQAGMEPVPAQMDCEQFQQEETDTPMQHAGMEPMPAEMDCEYTTQQDEVSRSSTQIDLNTFSPDLESTSAKAYALSMSRHKNVDSLRYLNVGDDNELDHACNTIRAFLSGISGTPLSDSVCSQSDSDLDARSVKNTYQMYKSVESVLNMCTVNLTLPAHFRESVLLYTLTGSKLALRILGSGGAHASYQSVKSWLAGMSSIPTDVSEGDIVVAFDNNQVLKRRWKVKLRNEVQCNIVTVVVNFNVSKEGRLQHKIDLKPNNWSSNPLTAEQVNKVKYLDKSEDTRNTHYNFLHSFLRNEIEKVASEQIDEDGNLHDHIDDIVHKTEKAALYKTCYQCHYDEIPKSKHTCTMCKVNVTKAKMKSMGLDPTGMVEETLTPQSSQRKEYRVYVEKSSGNVNSCKSTCVSQNETISEYNEFSEQMPTCNEIPTVDVHEPIYVNPCSYEAVGSVLRNIGRRCGVRQYGGDREWVIVVCDGVPYTLCHRLINSMHICPKCDMSLNGASDCVTHINEVHVGEDLNFAKEFDWVIIRPGTGHIEMNMVKGIVELGWDVFWKRMAMCMNFRSEAALNAAKKVSDHHKGWTMCRIARHALTEELVLPFVRMELVKEEPDISVAAFLKYTMKAQDPNYTFICDYTFELLDAIFLFRTGVRCSIGKFIEAGREKNMPSYGRAEGIPFTGS